MDLLMLLCTRRLTEWVVGCRTRSFLATRMLSDGLSLWLVVTEIVSVLDVVLDEPPSGVGEGSDDDYDDYGDESDGVSLLSPSMVPMRSVGLEVSWIVSMTSAMCSRSSWSGA